MTIPSTALSGATEIENAPDRPDQPAEVSEIPLRDLNDLASAVSGTVTLPQDSGWDTARSAWQLLVDQQPVAVVTALNRHDIALTLQVAAALGLRVAPQSTGHNAAPLGDLSRTILLRTSALNRVHVDVDRRVAHVGAGAMWADVTEAASAVGLTAIGGFAADVGILGLLLGGGLGWFARSHGVASNSVLALHVVTADGCVLRVDASSDLFEAILGGADVAVVTDVELRLHPLTNVVAGALFWPIGAIRTVFHAWADWSAEVPEAVTSVVRVVRFPNAPELPAAFAGRAFAVFEVVMQADPSDADALLEPLRALDPEFDTVAVTAPDALAGLHMDPPTPVHALSTSAVVRSLPVAVIDSLLDSLVDGPAAALTSVELRQLGGALDRGRTTAVSGSRALLHAVAVVPAPTASNIAAALSGLKSVSDAVQSVRSTRDVSSFVEVTTDAHRLFGAHVHELRAAKEHWDPDDRIHANHSVLTVL